jgi:hypothetical protein
MAKPNTNIAHRELVPWTWLIGRGSSLVAHGSSLMAHGVFAPLECWQACRLEGWKTIV